MNLQCMESVLSLGEVDEASLACNPSVRSLGKSPGETTPKKLLAVKELLASHGIDVVKIKFIFLHFVIRHDDLESVPTLLEHYGITIKDVGDYVHLGATTTGKVYPKIEPTNSWFNFALGES